MSGGLQDAPRCPVRPAPRFPARGAVSRGALVLALGLLANPLAAQEAAPAPAPTAAASTGAPRQIDFEANELSYNDQSDTVTARGNVILRSEDRSVRADEVVWDRISGKIIATGNIRLVD